MKLFALLLRPCQWFTSPKVPVQSPHTIQPSINLSCLSLSWLSLSLTKAQRQRWLLIHLQFRIHHRMTAAMIRNTTGGVQ